MRNRYTIQNSQPFKDGTPVTITTLVDDLNMMSRQLADTEAELNKIINEMDEGEEI